MPGGAGADAFETLAARAPGLEGRLALWRAARARIAAADRPEAAAHAFMKLTCAIALGFAWAELGAAARRSPDPERYARLAAMAAADTKADAARWAACDEAGRALRRDRISLATSCVAT